MTRTRSSFSLVSPFGFVVGSCAGFSSFFFGSFAGTGIGTVGADMVGIQGYRKGGGEVIKLSVRVHRVPIWDNAYCPYVSHAHDFERRAFHDLVPLPVLDSQSTSFALLTTRCLLHVSDKIYFLLQDLLLFDLSGQISATQCPR